MSRRGTQGSAPHLANAVVNLMSIREFARKELVKLLSSVRGAKALVLDMSLSGPLGLVAEVDLLKRNGVEQIYHLTDDELHTDLERVVYIVSPKIKLMEHIAKQVHAWNDSADKRAGMKRTHHVFFTPRKTLPCEKVLEEAGVYGDLRMGEFELELIPFDEDVLSLEMPLSFKECFLDGDPSSLFYIARSLIKMQSVFGLIPTVRGKGTQAKMVFNLMSRMRREMPPSHWTSVVPEVGSLVLIDRNVDMVTPLLTQLTYEGLIDEIFGIKNSYIDVDAEVVGKKEGGGKKKLPLNSADSLFKETRDLNFRVLGPLLHKKAEYIKDTYSERHSAQTVNEMHTFMQKFKTAHSDHTFLQTHINIAEQISQVTKSKKFDRRVDVERSLLTGHDAKECNEYIDSCIAKQEPMTQVLRLLCLQSLTQGIKEGRRQHLMHELLQTYGYEQMFTFNNLEKLGLFNKMERRTSAWHSIRKAFKLFTDEVDLNNPADLTYLYNGYAPLSARVVEAAVGPGWERQRDQLDSLPGPTFEASQELPGAAANSAAAGANGEERKPITMVVFIGGVTFSEISALRHLAEKQQRDFIIATTKLINGNTLMESIQEPVENNLRRATMKYYA